MILQRCRHATNLENILGGNFQGEHRAQKATYAGTVCLSPMISPRNGSQRETFGKSRSTMHDIEGDIMIDEPHLRKTL